MFDFISDDFFWQVVFPVIIATFIWTGLYIYYSIKTRSPRK